MSLELKQVSKSVDGTSHIYPTDLILQYITWHHTFRQNQPDAVDGRT